MASQCPNAAQFHDATRQANFILPASPDAMTPVITNAILPIIRPEAGVAWPRLVTLMSDTSLAFDAEVTWTGGKGAGGTFRCTAVGGIVRFVIAAATLQIRVANWSSVAHNVRASVDDVPTVPHGQQLTLIQRIGQLGIAATAGIPIPRFAKLLNVDSDLLAQNPNIALDFIDSFASIISTKVGTDTDIAVMPATRLDVTNNNGAVASSIVLDWRLSL